MKNKNKIIYSINMEDIQRVVDEELKRDLTEDELKKVIDLIGEKINWYDAILDSLNEVIDKTEFVTN